MPGFFISNEFKKNIKLNNQTGKCVEGHIDNDDICIKRKTLNKFLDDKIFEENDKYIVITEGILLNKSEIIQKYHQENYFDTIIFMYNKNEKFFEEFIGSFSGALYDKEKGRWIIWTNHTGDGGIFYYHNNGKYIVASQANYIFDTLKSYNASLTFNEQAAYSMLTYAFMYDDFTYANEINRLGPGKYIVIENGLFQIKQYWMLTNDKYYLSDLSDDELIDMLDEKFRHAVKLEFDKDIEYGYRHVADLSGGLDARMVTWVAKKLGYKNILNLHYSQSYSNEEVITKQIARYLDNELLIRPLDDANFLLDCERIVSMNFGLALYSGITGGESLLSDLNFDKFGMEHTGILNGAAIGAAYLKDKEDINRGILLGLYSTKLVDRLDKSHIYKYPNAEMYKFYVRGLNGISSTLFIRKNYTEAFAPSLNPDFLSFCFSIPKEKRIDHRIYKKWILNKYPDAAKFKWTANDAKITRSSLYIILHKIRTMGFSRLMAKLGIKPEKRGMNPFDYWYKNDYRLREYFDDYYEKNYRNSLFSDQLMMDIEYLYNQDSTIEKTQVLTLLAATKLYFK